MPFIRMSPDRVKERSECIRALAVGEGASDAREAGVGRFLEGVLPDADDFPALASKLAGDAFVAGHVDALAAGK